MKFMATGGKGRRNGTIRDGGVNEAFSEEAVASSCDCFHVFCLYASVGVCIYVCMYSYEANLVS